MGLFWRNIRRGFTLLEVLLALTVIAFLAGLIISFARLANNTARRQQARADLATWGEALHRWHARFGEYPNPLYVEEDDENRGYHNASITNGVPVFLLFHHSEFLDFEGDNPIPRLFPEQTGATTNASETALLLLNLKDPWGMDYRYRTFTPDTCEVFSPGPDSRPNTTDDIRLTP